MQKNFTLIISEQSSYNSVHCCTDKPFVLCFRICKTNVVRTNMSQNKLNYSSLDCYSDIFLENKSRNMKRTKKAYLYCIVKQNCNLQERQLEAFCLTM